MALPPLGHGSPLCAAGRCGERRCRCGPDLGTPPQLLQAARTHSPFEKGPVPTPGREVRRAGSGGSLETSDGGSRRRTGPRQPGLQAPAEPRVCGDGGCRRAPGEGLGSRGMSQRTQDCSLPLFLCLLLLLTAAKGSHGSLRRMSAGGAKNAIGPRASESQSLVSRMEAGPEGGIPLCE